MDVNKLLSSAYLRIVGDTTDDANGSKCLKTLLGSVPVAFKGTKRPDKMTVNGSQVLTTTQKTFTVHASTNNRDPDSKVHNGTLLINFYCPNYTSGNSNIECMGPVADRLVFLFDDKPLIIDGYNNFNLAVREPLGPLFDPDYPDEHFMSVRIQFNLYKK